MDNAGLNAKVDILVQAIVDERQQFVNTIAAKYQQIADLQNQIANLQNGISASDADAIAARLDQATTDVGTIVP